MEPSKAPSSSSLLWYMPFLVLLCALAHLLQHKTCIDPHSHSLCTGSTSWLCAMYNIVRVFSHCSLIRCRFDPMSSDELCIVLTTLYMHACTCVSALPLQSQGNWRCYTSFHPASRHHLKMGCMVYRLSEGHVWPHHLRHHQLPRLLPG